MAHTDGPKYLDKVSILSLHQMIVIRFYQHIKDAYNKHETISIILPPRSLFIFEKTFYTHFLHSIDIGTNQDYVYNDTTINIKNFTDEIQMKHKNEMFIKRNKSRISLTIRHKYQE